MPGKQVIAFADIPDDQKDKLRYAAQCISRGGVVELFYRPDVLTVANPNTAKGKRRAKFLEASGWVKLGLYTERNTEYLLEDVEWIREQITVLRNQPLNQTYEYGVHGMNANWRG